MAETPIKLLEPFVIGSASAASADGNDDDNSIVIAPVRALPIANFAWVLDVSAIASDATDSLDAYIQSKVDGENWLDIVHFTQVGGNATAPIRHYRRLATGNSGVTIEQADSLAADSARHIYGPELRLRWEITDGSGSAAFTFTAKGIAYPSG